jgi:Ca2+-binding EF-hand superfamily protein
VLRQEDITAITKSSGLDEAQVKQYFEAFVRDHPDGNMKPKDIQEIMEKALPKSDTSKMETMCTTTTRIMMVTLISQSS